MAGYSKFMTIGIAGSMALHAGLIFGIPAQGLQQDPRPSESMASVMNLKMIRDFDAGPQKSMDTGGAEWTVDADAVLADPAAGAGFADYFRNVKITIQDMAERRKPYGGSAGAVSVRFVLHRDGRIVRTEVIPEQSSPVKELQESAIQTVEDASPFQAFPDFIKHDYITFKIRISAQK